MGKVSIGENVAKSCKIFLFQKTKPFKNILLVSIYTIVLWGKNVKSMFKEESEGNHSV